MRQKYYMGIDPGKKGGVSVIDKYMKVCFSMEMPLTPAGNIDVLALARLIEMGEYYFCAIEKAQSMPGQGIVSTFNYGKGYGQLLSFLQIFNINYVEVTPQKWKKEFGLNSKKHKSLVMAEKLFPEEIFTTKGMRYMDGKAESLLLAEYARRLII